MPKLIVLVFGADANAATLAESAVEGAKRVRFTEVDVRVVNGSDARAPGQHRTLESADRIRDYDGVVISAGRGSRGGSAGSDVPMSDALVSVLDALEAQGPANAFANTVFGILGSDASLLARVARLGGIIVTEPRGSDDDAARANALGARMAKVVEWVRHALSHEQKDHAHSHHH